MKIGLALLLSLVIAASVMLRPSGSTTVERKYLAGNFSGALAELQLADEASPWTDRLLAANCFRHLGKIPECVQAVEQVRQMAGRSGGAQAAQARAEADLVLALLRVQSGQLTDEPGALIEVLSDAGARDSDARAAVISGVLFNRDFEAASRLLAQWQSVDTAQPLVDHLTAVQANIIGNAAEAELLWIAAIERFPQFELSWLALSETYSRPPQVRFAQAERLLSRMQTAFPDNAEVPAKLARIRRRLGLTAQAAEALPEPIRNEAEIIEKAAVAFDAGNYAQALEAYALLDLEQSRDFNQLSDAAFAATIQRSGSQTGSFQEELLSQWATRVTRAATAFALLGQHQSAEEVFSVSVDRSARLRRLEDIQVRRLLEPSNQELIDENNALTSPAYTPKYPTLRQLTEVDTDPRLHPAGLALYEQHCANCHGRQGDGAGIAAPNLDPPARRFQTEPIRFVSAANRLATDEDIKQSIRHGISGTSMPAFRELSNSEVQLLVDLLRTFMKIGAESNYDLWGGGDDPAQRDQWIAARTQPTDAITVPKLSTDEEQVARGKSLFNVTGCANCHAIETNNDNDVETEQIAVESALFDSLGRSLRAVDLASGVFRGGDSAEAIYRRIALGIPGTPHPAFAPIIQLEDQPHLAALVAYVLSIRPTP